MSDIAFFADLFLVTLMGSFALVIAAVATVISWRVVRWGFSNED